MIMILFYIYEKLVLKITLSFLVRKYPRSAPALSLRWRDVLREASLQNIWPKHVRSFYNQLAPFLFAIFNWSKRDKEICTLASELGQLSLFRFNWILMSYITTVVPESDVNLALNCAAVLSVLVILKLMVDVTSKLDYISIMSSGYGSVPYRWTLYLHLEPYCRVTTKSKEALPGFIGLNKN
jgi:hypothetical protein